MRAVWKSLAKSGSQAETLATPLKQLEGEVLPQCRFSRALALERQRAERSQRSFVLMLLKSPDFFGENAPSQVLDQTLMTLSVSTRETDIIGWYELGSTIGIIFTEIGAQPKEAARECLSRKMEAALRDAMGNQAFEQSTLTFHVYPEDPHSGGGPQSLDSALYPDVTYGMASKKSELRLKRAVDVLGSLFAIFLCAPLLLLISLAVKLTSKGPVLFRQQRIGQSGKPFTFLKFRSMYQNNDHTIHREYVTQLISARAETTSKTTTVYKLTSDPRITKIGGLLRRTSLDELPQLFNVLKGEMSLVGPRPPIPYELAAYAPWHRRRLMVVKPGITGLWQVAGRSRVTFDEMVRLDLRYAASWSLWLDLVILLQTPRAVITGHGAY